MASWPHMTSGASQAACPAARSGCLPSCALPLHTRLAQAYNEKQVKQLTRLIEVTRTDLSKADRQKVGRKTHGPGEADRLAWRSAVLRHHVQPRKHD